MGESKSLSNQNNYDYSRKDSGSVSNRKTEMVWLENERKFKLDTIQQAGDLAEIVNKQIAEQQLALDAAVQGRKQATTKAEIEQYETAMKAANDRISQLKQTLETDNLRRVAEIRKQHDFESLDVQGRISAIQAETDNMRAQVQAEINKLLMDGADYNSDSVKELLSRQEQHEKTAAKEQKRLQSERMKAVMAYGSLEEKAALRMQKHENDKANLKDLRQKKYEELRLKNAKELEGLTGIARLKKEAELRQQVEDDDEVKEAREETESLGATMKYAMDQMTVKLCNALTDLTKQVEEKMFVYAEHSAEFDARLAGSVYRWGAISDEVSDKLSAAGIVTQDTMIEKLGKLIDEGVALDLTERAFLLSIQDNIQKTFDVADGTLLRIIRLQRSDSTAQRLGMERLINKFLNHTFQDTSYLNESFDKVTDALLEATSYMSFEKSTGFEYMVQKWLGSLSSVGFSADSISTIAQGIGYLSSGDVSSLSSNDELQTLIAMSASRAGQSYSELLVTSPTILEINDLMKAMVEYLQEIAENENLVVRSEYAHLLGLKQSDLTAISRLSNSEIDSIYNNAVKTASKENELSDQMYKEAQQAIFDIGDNMHMSQQMENVFDNIMTSTAEELANGVSYIVYKGASILESLTGGIEIPFINVYGFGLDLNMSLEQLIKTGVTGLSFLTGALPGILSAVGSLATGDHPNYMKLTSWGNSDDGLTPLYKDGVYESQGTEIKAGAVNISEEELSRDAKEKQEEEEAKRGSESSSQEANDVTIIADDMFITGFSTEALGTLFTNLVLPIQQSLGGKVVNPFEEDEEDSPEETETPSTTTPGTPQTETPSTTPVKSGDVTIIGINEAVIDILKAAFPGNNALTQQNQNTNTEIKSDSELIQYMVNLGIMNPNSTKIWENRLDDTNENFVKFLPELFNNIVKKFEEISKQSPAYDVNVVGIKEGLIESLIQSNSENNQNLVKPLEDSVKLSNDQLLDYFMDMGIINDREHWEQKLEEASKGGKDNPYTFLPDLFQNVVTAINDKLNSIKHNGTADLIDNAYSVYVVGIESDIIKNILSPLGNSVGDITESVINNSSSILEDKADTIVNNQYNKNVLDYFVEKGIIKTPEYWEDKLKTIQYLPALFDNMYLALKVLSESGSQSNDENVINFDFKFPEILDVNVISITDFSSNALESLTTEIVSPLIEAILEASNSNIAEDIVANVDTSALDKISIGQLVTTIDLASNQQFIEAIKSAIKDGITNNLTHNGNFGAIPETIQSIYQLLNNIAKSNMYEAEYSGKSEMLTQADILMKIVEELQNMQQFGGGVRVNNSDFDDMITKVLSLGGI